MRGIDRVSMDAVLRLTYSEAFLRMLCNCFGIGVSCKFVSVCVSEREGGEREVRESEIRYIVNQREYSVQ